MCGVDCFVFMRLCYIFFNWYVHTVMCMYAIVHHTYQVQGNAGCRQKRFGIWSRCQRHRDNQWPRPETGKFSNTEMRKQNLTLLSRSGSRTYIHTNTHACMHTCIHTCIHARIYNLVCIIFTFRLTNRIGVWSDGWWTLCPKWFWSVYGKSHVTFTL